MALILSCYSEPVVNEEGGVDEVGDLMDDVAAPGVELGLSYYTKIKIKTKMSLFLWFFRNRHDMGRR